MGGEGRGAAGSDGMRNTNDIVISSNGRAEKRSVNEELGIVGVFAGGDAKKR